MKKFIIENKLAVTAVAFDILTIIAVIFAFRFDLITWAAIVLGITAIALNIKAKRKQKNKFKNQK